MYGYLGAWMPGCESNKEPNDVVVPGCGCDTNRYKGQRMKINVVFPNIFNKDHSKTFIKHSQR